jgi:ATP-binding cassette subfamily F protein uup
VLLVSHDRDFLDRVATSVFASEGDGRWVEYAGGYSDMVAQRGHGVEAKAVTRGTKAGADKPRGAPAAAKARLSFKETHALKTLPARMEETTAEIARLQAKLHDPDLYRKDRAAFDAASARLPALQAELAAMEEEWLALELKREELGG